MALKTVISADSRSAGEDSNRASKGERSSVLPGTAAGSGSTTGAWSGTSGSPIGDGASEVPTGTSISTGPVVSGPTSSRSWRRLSAAAGAVTAVSASTAVAPSATDSTGVSPPSSAVHAVPFHQRDRVLRIGSAYQPGTIRAARGSAADSVTGVESADSDGISRRALLRDGAAGCASVSEFRVSDTMIPPGRPA